MQQAGEAEREGGKRQGRKVSEAACCPPPPCPVTHRCLQPEELTPAAVGRASPAGAGTIYSLLPQPR